VYGPHDSELLGVRTRDIPNHNSAWMALSATPRRLYGEPRFVERLEPASALKSGEQYCSVTSACQLYSYPSSMCTGSRRLGLEVKNGVFLS